MCGDEAVNLSSTLTSDNKKSAWSQIRGFTHNFSIPVLLYNNALNLLNDSFQSRCCCGHFITLLC